MLSLFFIITLLFLQYLFKSTRIVCDSSFLERNRNQSFRGILALLIVFAHVSHDYNFPLSSEGKPYGMVVVGLFFFFSGYGLIKQYIVRRETYLECFLLKRLKKLLPSFFIVTTLCLVTEKMLNIKILEMGGGKIGYILVPNSWYVYVLLFYYMVFALSGRIFNKPIKVISMLFGATIILIVFTMILGLGDWWWKSSFAFNVGTMFPILEKKREKGIDISKGNNIFFFIYAILVLSAIPNVFSLSYYTVRSILMIVLTTVLPIYFYIVFRKIPFNGNKVLQFLGSISYEIYLIHGAVLLLIRHSFPCMKSTSCVIIIYLLTIVFSWPISIFSRCINQNKNFKTNVR